MCLEKLTECGGTTHQESLRCIDYSTMLNAAPGAYLTNEEGRWTQACRCHRDGGEVQEDCLSMLDKADMGCGMFEHVRWRQQADFCASRLSTDESSVITVLEYHTHAEVDSDLDVWVSKPNPCCPSPSVLSARPRARTCPCCLLVDDLPIEPSKCLAIVRLQVSKCTSFDESM